MNKLSDEILNKYIDGELNTASLQEVNNILSSSVDDRKRLNALLTIHKGLKQIKEDSVSASFTESLMKRLSFSQKADKEQYRFMIIISSIFILAMLAVVGLVIYFSFNQAGQSQEAANYSPHIISFFETIASGIAQVFSSKGISIFGSILSLGILISAYFFFESIKTSKQKIQKSI